MSHPKTASQAPATLTRYDALKRAIDMTNGKHAGTGLFLVTQENGGMILEQFDDRGCLPGETVDKAVALFGAAISLLQYAQSKIKQATEAEEKKMQQTALEVLVCGNALEQGIKHAVSVAIRQQVAVAMGRVPDSVEKVAEYERELDKVLQTALEKEVVTAAKRFLEKRVSVTDQAFEEGAAQAAGQTGA